MTSHDDLIRRLRESAIKVVETRYKEWGVLCTEAADALDAERLKRHQVEHERDSILEDLAGTKAALDAANEKLTRCAQDNVDLSADHGDTLIELDAARKNERRYQSALQEIKDTCGKVCDGFDLCAHIACSSSYGAWAIADASLAQGDTREPK